MAMKFGIAIAARIPMITTTIISSMRVKPFEFLSMVLHLPSGPAILDVISVRPTLPDEIKATDMPQRSPAPYGEVSLALPRVA